MNNTHTHTYVAAYGDRHEIFNINEKIEKLFEENYAKMPTPTRASRLWHGQANDAVNEKNKTNNNIITTKQKNA